MDFSEIKFTEDNIFEIGKEYEDQEECLFLMAINGRTQSVVIPASRMLNLKICK